MEDEIYNGCADAILISGSDGPMGLALGEYRKRIKRRELRALAPTNRSHRVRYRFNSTAMTSNGTLLVLSGRWVKASVCSTVPALALISSVRPSV
jgi:hypothetical protein